MSAAALPDGFLELPSVVYAADPGWLPEEPDLLRLLFSDLNPFFETGRAQAFCVPGAERIAVFARPGLELDGRHAAFFGYWETTGPVSLLDRAREWACAQGAEVLVGPINFSTLLGNRVLISSAPGARPFVGEPWNPLDYPKLLAANGFTCYRRYTSIMLDKSDVGALVADKAAILDRALAHGYRFDALTPQLWTEDVDGMLELANAVFAENVAFTPFTRAEFTSRVIPTLSAVVDPGCSVLARGPRGDIAGFIFMHPHYAPLCAQSAADRIPVSQLRFDTHASRTPATVVLKTGGTTPAHRRTGLAHAMVAVVAQRALDAGYDDMIVATMREDNPSRLLFPGYRGEHWYAMYRTHLG